MQMHIIWIALHFRYMRTLEFWLLGMQMLDDLFNILCCNSICWNPEHEIAFFTFCARFADKAFKHINDCYKSFTTFNIQLFSAC